MKIVLFDLKLQGLLVAWIQLQYRIHFNVVLPLAKGFVKMMSQSISNTSYLNYIH